jgi:UDP-N-acetylmuramoyl-tripeptide--D-alanyl-D-alanine ligase
VLGGPEHYRNQNTTKGICRRILKAQPWHRHIVLEVSVTKPGGMKKRAELVAPDVSIVTSIGSDHSDRFPTLQATREEKVALVRALPTDGLAVLNGDDPNVRWMAGETRAPVLTYGFGDQNDIWAEEPVMHWPDGMEFVVHTRSESVRVETQLLGRVMVYPLLAALAVGQHEGLPLARVVRSLSEVKPTAMRLEPIALPNGAYLLQDSCKASVESVEAALETFAKVPGRRLIVLGDISYVTDPTAVEPTYRKVAQRADRIASAVCILSQHYASCRPGHSSSKAPVHCENVFEVAAWLRGELRENDVVLLKGDWWQKFDRIALALRGELVRCGVTRCMATFYCASCPYLARLPGEVSKSEIAAMAPWGIHKVPHLSDRD